MGIEVNNRIIIISELQKKIIIELYIMSFSIKTLVITTTTQ